MRFLLSVLLTLLLTGCATRLTEHSFTFIRKDVAITYCFEALCAEANLDYSGSGVVVGDNRKINKKTRILTAGHVCTMWEEPPPPLYTEKVEQTIVIWDYDGNDHDAKIIATDDDKDMCLLETEWFPARSTTLGRQPTKHQKLYVHGAPMAVWAAGTSVVLEGRYLGVVDGEAKYSIPAAPGASGGPVFNYRGHLVGMLTSVIVPGYLVSCGPELSDIKRFLKENL